MDQLFWKICKVNEVDVKGMEGYDMLLQAWGLHEFRLLYDQFNVTNMSLCFKVKFCFIFIK